MNEILMSFRRLLQAIVKQSLEDKKYICHIFVFFPFFPLYVKKKKRLKGPYFFAASVFLLNEKKHVLFPLLFIYFCQNVWS